MVGRGRTKRDDIIIVIVIVVTNIIFIAFVHKLLKLQ